MIHNPKVEGFEESASSSPPYKTLPSDAMLRQAPLKCNFQGKDPPEKRAGPGEDCRQIPPRQLKFGVTSTL